MKVVEEEVGKSIDFLHIFPYTLGTETESLQRLKRECSGQA